MLIFLSFSLVWKISLVNTASCRNSHLLWAQDLHFCGWSSFSPCEHDFVYLVQLLELCHSWATLALIFLNFHTILLFFRFFTTDLVSYLSLQGYSLALRNHGQYRIYKYEWMTILFKFKIIWKFPIWNTISNYLCSCFLSLKLLSINSYFTNGLEFVFILIFPKAFFLDYY